MVRRGRYSRDGAEFGRGLGFFDAIYAFAITLLVTNIDLPPADAWRSLDALFDSGLGAQLLAFAISFIVIAAFWKGNATLLAEFRAFDGAVIVANLVCVAFIMLLPFTTQGISDAEVAELPLPTVLYAVNVALVICARQLIFEVGNARGLMITAPSPALVRAWRVDAGAQIAVFAGSIALALLVGPDWGRTTWLALVIVSPLTGRWVERLSRADEESERSAGESS